MEHQGKDFMGCDYNIDETYIKVKGQWYYLYRAVDKTGQTIDFLLTEAPRRAGGQALSDQGDPPPRRAREDHHRRECGQ